MAADTTGLCLERTKTTWNHVHKRTSLINNYSTAFLITKSPPLLITTIPPTCMLLNKAERKHVFSRQISILVFSLFLVSLFGQIIIGICAIEPVFIIVNHNKKEKMAYNVI